MKSRKRENAGLFLMVAGAAEMGWSSGGPLGLGIALIVAGFVVVVA